MTKVNNYSFKNKTQVKSIKDYSKSLVQRINNTVAAQKV